ncbi:MAG: type I-B CRISPR-associated endonuclease Cas1b [Candidatus Eremiobacterota bacterium]
MKKTIYLFNSGKLQRKDNTICFELEEGKKYLPVENIREIMVFGEVDLNKRFLEFISSKEILIHFFNHYGYYSGSFYPREHYNSGYMILKQAELYSNDTKRIELAKKFILGAIQNIQKVLSYYNSRGKDLSEIIESIDNLKSSLPNCADTNVLMGIEGNIRDKYYDAFDIILNNPDFKFEKRTRRPPQNKLNSLISFGNSLLYTKVLSEIYKTHLDPRIGFLHTTNFRRFSLNLDVAEIFKPIIVDRIIFTLINKNMLKNTHFEKKSGGIFLNDKGRELFLKEMEERERTTIDHKKLGRKVSYRRLIRMDLYKLEKHLIGEEDYEPYVSGW